MRIAFFAGYLSRRASGVREVVEHLSRALVDRGHDVRVFGLENIDWRAGDNKLWSGAPAFVAPPRGPAALGYAPEWWSELNAFKPDVVHLHGLWMYSAAVAARWARKIADGVLVVSPHGMLSRVALRYSPARKRLAGWLYQKRCFLETDLYHATSAIEALAIRNYGLTAPIEVIPHGLHDMPAGLRNNKPDRKNTVVSLGRLHRVKGLERLLRAWATLESDFPSWDLRIIGSDAGDGYLGELNALAERLRLERVGFNGAVLGDDKWKPLLAAELFVLPAESENFALTVLEALLAELPVVSTDGAPWSQLIDQGCGWYVPRSDDALAAALAEGMALQHDFRRKMGETGRAWVLRDFRWSAIAERFEDNYSVALARRN